MVLAWVEIDRVDASWISIADVVLDVISSGGFTEDNVVVAYSQQSVVSPGVFPGKSVNIFIFELNMLL